MPFAPATIVIGDTCNVITELRETTTETHCVLKVCDIEQRNLSCDAIDI